jgi:hypothetical protein
LTETNPVLRDVATFKKLRAVSRHAFFVALLTFVADVDRVRKLFDIEDGG